MQLSPRARLVPAALVALGVTAAGAAQASAADRPERRVQVAMVNFTDSRIPDAGTLENALKDNYFGAGSSLTSYYNEVTGGATTFEAARGDGIAGPVDIDLPAAGCDTGKINDLTRAALAEQGVPEDSYDHLSLVFPAEKAGCDWLALGTVGGGTTWMPVGADGKMSMTALVHEFGHNFGYSHHMRLRCPDGDLGAGCKEDGTSHKTPMGGGGWEAGLTSPELLHNSWLTGDEAKRVGASGTYELRPLYGKGGGVRALDIPLGDDRLVVELRHGSGTLDGEIQGVHAYRVPGGDYAKSALIDPTPDADESTGGDAPADADALAAGTRLTDTARKLEVEVVKAGADAATVSVSLDGVAAPQSAASGTGPDTDAPARTKAEAGGAGTGAGSGAGTDAADGVRPAGGTSELAETGADSGTSVPATVGGGLLLAIGAAFVLRSRRRTAAVTSPRSSRRSSRRSSGRSSRRHSR
ncbi:LPXTG cell wall anchor domain-containing protein [Streptomyces sp. NPDC047123]|uniref:LPXTG cell wall anchor domain-containing protein n=1 Tax=Streptomyces sp. NPDC047123 TaxID=3155622 RepID=UPI0033E89809